MTIEIQNLQRIAVGEETTFATALGSGLLDIPFKEGSATMTVDIAMLNPQTAQQYKDGYPEQIIGPSSATLTFTMPLHGLGTAADDSTASLGKTDAALLKLLYLCYGGIASGGQGSTVSGGSATTTSIPVQAGHGSRFAIGQAVGVLSGDNGELEVAEIDDISTDTLTLAQALSNSPSDTDAVYNVTTIYPDENPNLSIQCIVEGAETNDYWVLLGGQCTTPPSISRTTGEIPEITFTLEFASYSNSTGALAAATYSNYNPIYAHGFWTWTAGGSSTVFTPDVGSVSYTMNGPSWLKLMSPSGTNTVARWVRKRAVPFAECQFTLPFENMNLQNRRTNKSLMAIRDQLGTSAGSTICISLPACQVTNAQRVAENELAYEQITVQTQLDAYKTAQTTALLRAPLRIHFA